MEILWIETAAFHLPKDYYYYNYYHYYYTCYHLMQGIYNYIPETSHVPTVYSVAAVLYLQSVLHVMLFPS